LGLVVAKSRPDPFIRSVYWEVPPPPPPRPLADIQLKRLDLTRLVLTARPDVQSPAQRATLDLTEQATVLPLMPSADAATVDLVRSSLGSVVAFLEETSGLRYIPAPTLLVDRLTVRAVRAVETVDKPDPSATHRDTNEAWLLPLLGALLMAFHNAKLEGVSWSDQPAFHQLGGGEPLGNFSHVRHHSEAGFCGLVEKRLAGHDPMRLPGGWAEALAEADSADSPSLQFFKLYHVKSFLERVAGIATADEVALLRALPGLSLKEDSDRVSAELDEKNWRATRKALNEPQLQSMIEKYNTTFSALFSGERSTLARSPDFPAYVRGFLDILMTYAHRALTIRGPVLIETYFFGSRHLFEAARSHFAQLHITRVEKRERRDDVVYFEIRLDDYLTCLDELQERVLALLASAPSSPLRRLVEASVPAYGIFASARSAAAQERLERMTQAARLSAAMVLPGTNKVLLSVDAVNALTAELKAAGEADADRRATDLLRLVLVHEHFHAALAGGLDGQGHVASAGRWPDRWERGAALNESLATWSELHFARNDPWLTARVREYINAGSYPDWPYRGADRVEQIFDAGGNLAGVRELIRCFRSDPALAQELFDNAAPGTSPAAT
jgi:hypothetical protein